MMPKNEQAVSPVVGVMLMLVVTIIIAALVSAFSGGAVSGNEKAPQAMIQATYSQTYGMIISHSGGEAIPVASTKVIVKPSRAFGEDASRYSWSVNKSRIFANTSQTWATSRAFVAGDTVSISAANLSYVQQRPDLITSDANDPLLGFANPNNLGLSFELQFQDSSGKTIGQSIVTISR